MTPRADGSGPSEWALKLAVDSVLEDEVPYLPADLLTKKVRDVAAALDHARTQGREEGRRDEREAVVEWLRGPAGYVSGPGADDDRYWNAYADAIEQGAHLPTPGGGDRSGALPEDPTTVASDSEPAEDREP